MHKGSTQKLFLLLTGGLLTVALCILLCGPVLGLEWFVYLGIIGLISVLFLASFLVPCWTGTMIISRRLPHNRWLSALASGLVIGYSVFLSTYVGVSFTPNLVSWPLVDKLLFAAKIGIGAGVVVPIASNLQSYIRNE